MRARYIRLATVIAGLGATSAMAQTHGTEPPPSPLAESQLTWQQCQRLGENDARLACFDRWAQQQTLPAAQVPPAPPVLAATPAPPVDANIPATRVITLGNTNDDGCRDRQYSPLSRFWELEKGSSCGTFGFRGYRPISVSLGTSPEPPPTPYSPTQGFGKPQPYQSAEMRIGLSVRTKLAEGLLTGTSDNKDGLWFAYSQFSAWQVFNEEISRPFRANDHEPELIYSYPLNIDLWGGWKMRYAGLALNHESNGESDPYSRSWNRVMLIGGAELGDTYAFTWKFWQRINESLAKDDNPDISNYYGRAEFKALWQPDRLNTFDVTLRSNLRADGHGSIMLEWLKVIGDPARSNLRLQTQLFYGYGDTMINYNVKRTVFSVGLALVDF